MNRSEYFALRINHFLKGYRKKNDLTQIELASRLKTTKSTVSRIENGQDKQIHEVLAILERLGQLEGMDLGHFLTYLDGKQASDKQGPLFPWQTSVLNALAPIKQSVRLDVVSEIMPKEATEVEYLLTLLVQINRLPKDSQRLIEKLVGEMRK